MTPATPGPEKTISDARVQELLKLVTFHRIDGTTPEQLREEIAAVLRAYLHLRAREREQGWIAVTERLPEKKDSDVFGSVLWWWKKAGYAIDDKWDIDRRRDYTHWRHYPAPPPEKQE